jgi:multidrug resistance protein
MPAMSAPARSPIGLIFLTIFIDMVGFGIMIPVLPLYATGSEFAATPAQLGWLVGIYSLLQLVFSPIFGKISDRVGRKPVLVFSILGTAVGFTILGAAHSLWMLFLGRIIDGASGGNIATAQACIADVTPPEHRAKSMGLIGVAFRLGFIIGPALGGWLSHAFSLSTPYYVAAGLAFLNALLVWMRLPETHGPEHRVQSHERASLMEVFQGGHARMILMIILAYLASIMGFSMMTSLFALFCAKRFEFNPQSIGGLLAYVGVIGVLVQGGVIRRLLKRPIEKQIALVGSAILALSMFALPLTASMGALLLVCAGIAVGNGFVTPMLNGLASKHTHRKAQGRVLGLMQSAGSMGRFLGPQLAFWLLTFDLQAPLSQYGRTAFWASAGILVVAMVFIASVSPGAAPAADESPVGE